MNAQVAVVRCRSYDRDLVQEAVRKALDLAGGLTNFVKPGSRVLVKPNLLMAVGPETGVDTHPEVVRAVIRLLKYLNCKIILGDGPSVWGNQTENIDDVYRRSGMKNVAEEEGIELVVFDRKRWRQKFPLTTRLDEVDYLVSIPKFKTHCLTLLTGAVKNLFGLIPGRFKTELHKNYFEADKFSGILADIYEQARPAITVVDGIVAMEGDGPGTSGKLRDTGLILAGTDGVAIDSILALVMGVDPFEVPTIKEAAKRGLGVAETHHIQILGEKIEGLIGRPFLLPSSSPATRLPRPLVELAKKFIRHYPCVERDNCVKCAACIQACPNKAMRMKNERVVIDYAKCIACFCCEEACPASAIKVKRSVLAKITGL